MFLAFEARLMVGTRLRLQSEVGGLLDLKVLLFRVSEGAGRMN